LLKNLCTFAFLRRKEHAETTIWQNYTYFISRPMHHSINRMQQKDITFEHRQNYQEKEDPV